MNRSPLRKNSRSVEFLSLVHPKAHMDILLVWKQKTLLMLESYNCIFVDYIYTASDQHKLDDN